MIRADRLPEPAALSATDADSTTELERARTHFSAIRITKKFGFKVYGHKTVRASLIEMFHGKCSYCEANCSANYTEEIEHFRPKARIDTETGSITPGYWWLGSDWDNLLISCSRCNKAKRLLLFDGTRLKVGKGNRFPITDENQRAKGEGQEVNETALLIHPCIDDPEQYITYKIIDDHCIAVPISTDESSIEFKKARTSIDIYGLNRMSLVKARTESCKRLQRDIKIYFLLKEKTSQNTSNIVDEQIKEELFDSITESIDPKSEFSAANKFIVRSAFKNIVYII